MIPAREYALVFATAALVTYLITGLVRVLARRVGAVTEIRDRDMHTLPTPRMGGVAVYIGLAAGVLVAFHLPALSQAFSTSSEIPGVLVAGAVICLVGVLDDRFDLDAVTKLAGQVLAAGVLVMFGVQWTQVWLPLDHGGTLVSLDQAQGLLITVLITVVLTNAMNFIDGLDGLLAGVALISAVGIFVFSAHQLAVSHNGAAASQPPLIAAALIGACLGFLPHNFDPARIFLGDSGSMFIGLTMAAAIVSAGGKLDSSTYGPRSTIAALAPLIVVLAVVFIPLLDLLLAVIRRTREGRHPFSADTRHLHHRMLNIGHTKRQAVLTFYLWAAVLSGSAVSLAFLPWTTAIGPAVVLILLAVVVSAWPRVRARRLSRARTPGSPPEITGAIP
ncbi:MAG: undecaprenyl/decaprenyl-phosphate alpha-N-acetylglucosaminyl 1-phosphate transferase [Actinomycetota bacterium]|nr:undecaprenyl/decaprenyl-phosphate alpha-N-acetylglucosaminyl 1-phosphate transferase [Actinomycetota bacterium]